MFLQFLRSILAGCRKRIYYRQCHDVNGSPFAFRRLGLGAGKTGAMGSVVRDFQAYEMAVPQRIFSGNFGYDNSLTVDIS
jgi:hypothetical protein